MFRVRTYTENALSSTSAQSSPSRNITENENVPTAIPVAIPGRQVPASRSARTLHANSTSLMSTNVSNSSVGPMQVQNGSRQTVYNSIQQIGTQNNLQLFSTANRLTNSASHGAGAIPRRSVRRGNSAAEEEQSSDKQ